MWRRGFGSATQNIQESEQNCGGFENHWIFQRGRCGVCGDPYQEWPRSHEAGGRYATGVIGKHYTMSSIISVTVQLTDNKRGYFEFKLCPNNDPTIAVTQACLDRYFLPVVGSRSGRYHVKDTDRGDVVLQLYLPFGLTCSQCILQWKYRAGSRSGCDGDGRCGVGYGNQDEFYACSDIAILGGINSGSPSDAATGVIPGTREQRHMPGNGDREPMMLIPVSTWLDIITKRQIRQHDQTPFTATLLSSQTSFQPALRNTLSVNGNLPGGSQRMPIGLSRGAQGLMPRGTHPSPSWSSAEGRQRSLGSTWISRPNFANEAPGMKQGLSNNAQNLQGSPNPSFPQPLPFTPDPSRLSNTRIGMSVVRDITETRSSTLTGFGGNRPFQTPIQQPPNVPQPALPMSAFPNAISQRNSQASSSPWLQSGGPRSSASQVALQQPFIDNPNGPQSAPPMSAFPTGPPRNVNAFRPPGMQLGGNDHSAAVSQVTFQQRRVNQPRFDAIEQAHPAFSSDFRPFQPFLDPTATGSILHQGALNFPPTPTGTDHTRNTQQDRNSNNNLQSFVHRFGFGAPQVPSSTARGFQQTEPNALLTEFTPNNPNRQISQSVALADDITRQMTSSVSRDIILNRQNSLLQSGNINPNDGINLPNGIRVQAPSFSASGMLGPFHDRLPPQPSRTAHDTSQDLFPIPPAFDSSSASGAEPSGAQFPHAGGNNRPFDNERLLQTNSNRLSEGARGGFNRVSGSCKTTAEYALVHGMEAWCETNCRAGNCPRTMCACHDDSESSNQQLVPPGENRFEVMDNGEMAAGDRFLNSAACGGFATMRQLNNWCQEHCQGRPCTPGLCTCT